MNVCLAHGGDVSQPSGGTDRVTALAAGLQARQFDVTLVVPEPAGIHPERLDDVDVRTVATDRLPVGGAATRAAKIARTAQSIAVDRGAVLQLEHSSLAGVGTLCGCDGFVLDMHDIAYPRFEHVETPAAPLLKRGVAWLERRAVDRASHIVVVSEFMQRKLTEEWDVPEQQTTVIPNGYFPERIERGRDTETEPGRVCFLGTLHPKVDVDAFATIARLPEVSELVIIGDGAQRSQIERLAKTHDSVRATGRLPDEEAFDLLGSAEVLVNPQTASDLQRSSSPVKLFYYAALGKPMVVTSGPSIVRGLVDANAARTAETRTEFVKHVRAVLSDQSSCRELSQNAREVANDFVWSKRADHLASVYDRRRSEVVR